MNENEVNSYKEKLLLLRRELVTQVGEALEETQQEIKAQTSDGTGDFGDIAMTDQVSYLGLSAAGRHSAQLRAVDEALLRIERGEYGICIDCGEAIPEQRLLADPAVSRCVNCQALSERTFAEKDATPSL
jgi:DnaK suppressor protein